MDEIMPGGGIKIIDLSFQVRNLMRYKPTERDLSGVYRLFVHHSGADGAKGRRGALNSCRYTLKIRGWRMPAYHFWIPREPDGSSVEIYQLSPVAWRNYHTGGEANDHGIGLVVQGNTSKQAISSHQEEALEAMIPWIEEVYLMDCPEGEDWLSWHSEAGKYGGKQKSSCPGTRLQNWLEDYREGIGMFPDAEWQ